MKKIFIILIVFNFIFLSCQKGDTGDTGATGPSGEDGKPIYKIEFQEGLLPDDAYTGTYDTRILNGSVSNYNFGGCFNIACGYDSGYIYRILIKFSNIENYIDSSAIVESAYITLYSYSLTGTPSFIAYKVTKDWTEGSSDCGGSADVNASWDYYDGTGNNWSTPGGDYDTSSASEITTVNSTGYFTIKLDKNMVQKWIQNPSQNFGVIIKSVDESQNVFSANYDKTNSTLHFRPKLTIYYSLP